MADAAAPIPKPKPRRFWTVFKWLRVLCWLFLLFLVAGFIYLNQIGLPEFLKKPMLAELEDRGLELKFNRLRFRWFRGLVADGVELSRTGPRAAEKAFFAEVVLGLNWPALKKGQLSVESLGLRDGSVEWTLGGTNAPPIPLRLHNIDSQLLIAKRDSWHLEQLSGEFEGIQLKLEGSLTNISAWQKWSAKKKRGEKKGPGIEPALRQFLDFIRRARFAATPTATIHFHADGAQMENSTAELRLEIPEVTSRLGNLEKLFVEARFSPGTTSSLRRVEVKLTSGPGIVLETNSFSALSASGDFEFPVEGSAESSGHFDLDLSGLSNHWARASKFHLVGDFSGPLTNLPAGRVSGNVSLNNFTNQWAGISSGKIGFQVAPAGEVAVGPDWSHWKKLAPWKIELQADLVRIATSKLKVDALKTSCSWTAPEFTLGQFQARLYDGGVSATGRVDVATRRGELEGKCDFETTHIYPLLTRRSREWAEQFGWKSPPLLAARMSATLPPWTNWQVNWRREVVPSLFLHGSFKANECSFQGIPALEASSHYIYSNMVWYLPDLHARRSEGDVKINYWKNETSRDYYWQIESGLWPDAYRVLVKTNAHPLFDQFRFDTPPQVEVEIWGNWRARDRMGWKAQGTVTNFQFRGENIQHFASRVEYTNNSIRFIDPEMEHVTGTAQATQVEVDLTGKNVVLSNAQSRMDPMVVARMIGRKVARTIEPYQFGETPAIRANGRLNFQNIREVDLRFDIVGRQFHWWKFNFDHAMSLLHWTNQWLYLTNFSAVGYGGGQVAGNVVFDFNSSPGADFSLDLSVAELQLPPLIRDLTVATNKLEGLLYGQLTVTTANTADWESWQGFGKLNVREGVLWDIPIFGIFSPIFNAMIPGLGHSRASEASGRFNIASSVIQTEDLEIRAKTLRMNYRGTLDFNWNIDAKVEAEIFRDAGVLGHVVSVVLKPISKLFEYKVSGTLARPEAKPIYIPKLLLMPFRPFHTLKEWFDFDTKKEKAEPPPPLENNEKVP